MSYTGRCDIAVLENQLGKAETHRLLKEHLSLPLQEKVFLQLQALDRVEKKQARKRQTEDWKAKRIRLKRRKTALLARKTILREGHFEYGTLDSEDDGSKNGDGDDGKEQSESI